MTRRVYEQEIEVNQANWNARATVHAKSKSYDLERYVKDPSAISSVVDTDRRILGEVKGLDMLHLQCHIGTDTISWARLGANVTGLDFSSQSLRVARDLAKRTGAQVEFIEANVYEADKVLGRQFDLVYTSVGVLCWLPDVREWSRAVAACVRPGGRFYIRDGHPVMVTIDFHRDSLPVVCVDDYFGDGTPDRYEDEYTYTGDKVRLDSTVTYEWKHSLGSIITALAEHGLRIVRVDEYDWIDWKPFAWMVESQEGHWTFPPGQPRLPLSFSILAERPSDGR